MKFDREPLRSNFDTEEEYEMALAAYEYAEYCWMEAQEEKRWND